MNINKTWHILGAGSIGCWWASHLHQANEPVILFIRNQQHYQLYQQQTGILLHKNQASTLVKVPIEVINSQNTPIDQLLLCVKAYDAAMALKSIAHRLHQNSIIVLMQNGLGVLEEVTQLKIPGNLLIGLSTIGCYYQKHFNVFHSGDGHLLVGSPQNNFPFLLQDTIVNSLKVVAQNIVWSDEIINQQWQKFAVNCAINAPSAIFNCPNGALLTNPKAKLLMKIICQEIETIIDRLKINIAMPTYQQAAQVAKATAKNYSSMWQDIQNNRKTEINYLNGYAYKLGKDLNIRMPYNRLLYQMISQRGPA